MFRQIFINCLPTESLVFLFVLNWHSYIQEIHTQYYAMFLLATIKLSLSEHANRIS